jgi:hypothetical protein
MKLTEEQSRCPGRGGDGHEIHGRFRKTQKKESDLRACSILMPIGKCAAIRALGLEKFIFVAALRAIPRLC